MTTTLGVATQLDFEPSLEQRMANEMAIDPDQFVYAVDVYNRKIVNIRGFRIGGHMVVTGRVFNRPEPASFYFEIDDTRRQPFSEDTITMLGQIALSKPAVESCGL